MLTADYRYNTGGYLNSFSFLKQHKQQYLLWLLKSNKKRVLFVLPHTKILFSDHYLVEEAWIMALKSNWRPTWRQATSLCPNRHGEREDTLKQDFFLKLSVTPRLLTSSWQSKSTEVLFRLDVPFLREVISYLDEAVGSVRVKPPSP